MSERDEILELAALTIEERSLLDMRGLLSKRKRDREDAELRAKSRDELRTELADHIRSLKSDRRRDSVSILAELAALDGRRHDLYLIEAWPLAWKGWVDIFCTVKLNSNSIPPETIYRIEITEAGRTALASAERAGEKE